MFEVENIVAKVRSRLQFLSIQLWLEPYYFEEIGSIESEIDRLAKDFSETLGISISKCKMALTELQEGALRKLESRKEFDETGVATISVRRINNHEGTQNVFDIKCPLTILGSELHDIIAKRLTSTESSQVKCISAGKIVEPTRTLAAQGLKNNQSLMLIISQLDKTHSDAKEALYDRINKIKEDVEAIVDSKQQFFEMEDQDGNPVFLPPDENRALLLAMSYCEKARAAIKRLHYDEALILFLEADEKFITCNSKFLETVDNYALVNLDIVWCYLCLKNVTQLPDAQRRLDICEKSFRRSYGENMNRLIALKGETCPERALIMRLHLLQGVVHYHQNQREAAKEKLEMAAEELRLLKVDDAAVEMLVEMGYAAIDARLALRSSGGNINRAINFIHDRREKVRLARERSEKERSVNRKLARGETEDKDWVNPRSVCTLLEMGFSSELVVQALKQSKNDLQVALDLLQTNPEELLRNMPPAQRADDTLVDQLKKLGFNEDMVRVALETTHNNLDKSIDFLVKIFGNLENLRSTMEQASQNNADESSAPSTSTGRRSTTALFDKVMHKAKAEMDSFKAYKRFHEDVAGNEHEYLDLPLDQEERLLAEYRVLLERW